MNPAHAAVARNINIAMGREVDSYAVRKELLTARGITKRRLVTKIMCCQEVLTAYMRFLAA